MLRQKLGEEIDEHDAVFRINYPPTENFEEYVGSKTTVELVNHHHARVRSPQSVSMRNVGSRRSGGSIHHK